MTQQIKAHDVRSGDRLMSGGAAGDVVIGFQRRPNDPIGGRLHTRGGQAGRNDHLTFCYPVDPDAVITVEREGATT